MYTERNENNDESIQIVTTGNMENRIKALYESVGRGFESLPSHQEKPVHVVYWFFFLSAQWKGLEQGGGAQRRKQSAQWAVA